MPHRVPPQIEFLTSRIVRLLAILLLAGAPVASQIKNRIIEWPEKSTFNSRTNTTPDNHVIDRIDEIEIESIVVEGQSVTIGEPFAAGDDWLREISFRVKNVSNRSIKHIQITLILPEIKHGPDIPYLCLACGRKAENPLLPGLETDLTLPGGGLYAW